MTTDKEYISGHLPRHAEDSHKGNRGRVLIIGGSIGLTGAVCMAANAALKSGVGLIKAAVPKSLNNIFEMKLTEVMTVMLSDVNGRFDVAAGMEALGAANGCDAVAVGPGAGDSDGTFEIVKKLIGCYRNKLILDADALNVLERNTSFLSGAKCEILLTPHLGEMSRLINKPIEFITHNRIAVAEDFARKYQVNLLLKGKETIITDGVRTFINPTGNKGMAKGGSGDVLTGICSGLAAQGVPLFESGVLGAYIHGMAGDIACEKYTDYAMTPTDIIDNLHNAFKIFI